MAAPEGFDAAVEPEAYVAAFGPEVGSWARLVPVQGPRSRFSVVVGPLGDAWRVLGTDRRPAERRPLTRRPVLSILRGGTQLSKFRKLVTVGAWRPRWRWSPSWAPAPSGASSHREALQISQDPVADNTDTYAFVSPDKPDTVTLVGNWIPLEEPAGGPNFHNFGDDVKYAERRQRR